MVVFIIAALLILTIPNITKHQQGVEETSCDAFVSMVQTQIAAYQLVEGADPSIEDLVANGYIPSGECSDGRTVVIDESGKVTIGG